MHSRDPKRPGYIYLVQCGALFKIGLTIRPDVRAGELRRLESGCNFSFVQQEIEQGHRPHMLYYFQVLNMKRVEKALHSRFQSVRCHEKTYYGWARFAEWFRLTPEDVDWFCTLNSQDEETLCQMSQC